MINHPRRAPSSPSSPRLGAASSRASRAASKSARPPGSPTSSGDRSDEEHWDADPADEADRYTPPPDDEIKSRQRREFVNALHTLFKIRAKKPGLKSLIEPFFLEVFQTRDQLGFALAEIDDIEELQAAIKHKRAARGLGIINNPLEAQNPVVDARSAIGVGTQDWGSGANW